MCRYVSYLGDPLSLADLVYNPENSLIHQATEAMESRTRINADGFGIGWYTPAVHPEPAVFKDISPAWNNANLRSLSGTVVSPCILSHVRAARRFDPVSRANCHPFQFGRLLWMHNGDVPGRGRLLRRVCERIPDDLAARITGNTDSELAFLLLLSFIKYPSARRIETAELVAAFRLVVEQLVAWWRADGTTDPLVLNFCATAGEQLVASRLALGEVEVPTLHYCVGGGYSCEGATCRMRPSDGQPRSAIVSSEIVSEDDHWVEVENGSLVVVHTDLSIEVQPLAQA